MLKDITGAEVEPVYEDPRPGEVRHSQASIEKARDAFGYDPQVEIREGLQRTVEWFESVREEALRNS